MILRRFCAFFQQNSTSRKCLPVVPARSDSLYFYAFPCFSVLCCTLFSRNKFTTYSFLVTTFSSDFFYLYILPLCINIIVSLIVVVNEMFPLLRNVWVCVCVWCSSWMNWCWCCRCVIHLSCIATFSQYIKPCSIFLRSYFSDKLFCRIRYH